MVIFKKYKIFLLIVCFGLLFSKERALISFNPVGLYTGGLSNITYERMDSDMNYSISMRLDYWQVILEDEYYDNDLDSYETYTTSTSKGWGLGFLLKDYLFSFDYFSGLYHGYGFDFVFANIEDVDVEYDDTFTTSNYKGYALAPYYNIGASFGLFDVRFNPSISLAYLYTYDEYYGGSFDYMILPEIHFCYIIK
tara:strand:+ start:85 stop:669 length:585 start_codon:yes stop_codon:yes gene_type:complete